MSIMDRLIGVVAPYECLGCRKEGSLLCPVCLAALPPTNAYNLIGDIAYAATPYQGIAKDLIWKLKSSGAQAAARVMAELMYRQLPDKSYLIVPLPTATARVRQRGYDQARLLARALSRRSGLPFSNCLVRMGQAHQVGAGRGQRLQQLEGAFRVKSTAQIENKTILLVDDVTTTGASLRAAARVLKQAGANRVDAVTFARA